MHRSHPDHRVAGRIVRSVTAAVTALALAAQASAVRIADLGEVDLAEQAWRFVTLADSAVNTSLLGCLLLGLACGLLGSFLLVRRLSLTGDALAHAVLPGILLGFLWTGTRNPVVLLIGATATGLLSLGLLLMLRRTTRLKEDALLGLLLTAFYAAGVFLLSIAQRSTNGNQAGIEGALLGQAAALNEADVQVIAVACGLAVLFLWLFFKELKTHAFDPGFAQATGMPVRLLERVFLLLLTFTVVTALQAVGVVLVSALLITPAATAYLLTRRLGPLCLVAGATGMLAAASGAFVSSLDSGLPTGPFIVLAATAMFVAALLFAPRRGVVSKLLQRSRTVDRVRLENSLKRAYHAIESRSDGSSSVTAAELGGHGGEIEGKATARALVRAGFATPDATGGNVLLTPEGSRRAATVVRNHRLWELYLTHAAEVPADHVHDDAEDMEHLLNEETVRQLERRLAFAQTDPHGKRIPQTDELEGNQPAPRPTPMEGGS